MDSRITSLYNEYIHGDMPRREFFRRVTEIAGSTAAATALLALLEPDWALGRQVDPDDQRLATEAVTYEGTTGPVRGYLARPAKAEGPLPGILVIHENRGLNAHIEDVARRAALAGYVALAPDGLSYVGGGLEDQEAARDRFRDADRDKITADVIAGVPYLAARDGCSGRVGTVGFCYGGGVALQCAVREKAVAAAVCFYGRALSAEDVAKVTVPLMMHYAGTDERINAGIPEFRAALDEHEVAYSLHMYPGTGHGFHNDTSQARYDADAAGLAWRRTLRFFEDYLGKA
jgi:carboxymethylenebutenolidase